MINDPTILRLVFSDGGPQQVQPHKLADLCAGLELFAVETIKRYTKVDVKFVLYLVAAPRQGS